MRIERQNHSMSAPPTSASPRHSHTTPQAPHHADAVNSPEVELWGMTSHQRGLRGRSASPPLEKRVQNVLARVAAETSATLRSTQVVRAGIVEDPIGDSCQ